MTVPGGSVATVVAVALFPVKGAGSAATTVLTLDAAGVIGDRRHAVLDADGAPLTADRAPVLRTVRAALDDDGTLHVDVPGHGVGLVAAAADAALSALLGQPVRLASVPAGSQLDAPVHLVSRQAVDAARRGEHELADCACSLQEPRANLVLDLAPSVGAEEAWVGGLVRVGDALLRVHRRPGHCLGIYAEVVTPGRVQVGDTLAPVRPAESGRPSR